MVAKEEITPRRKFFIFGHNISHSLSPTIHNTAFAALGLPHHYAIHETVNIDESNVQILQSPDFGGASVTFPHKLSIQPHLHSLSEGAQKTGAVNTVIPGEIGADGARILRGDNTDWQGIMRCIQRSQVTAPQSAIVVGAGGAARAAVYALQRLGCRSVTLVNRTRETAEKLCADFPSMKIDILPSLQEVSVALNVVVACVPADDLREEDIPVKIFAPGPGVVVEMSYRPPVSALMRVARLQEMWKVFGGVDVLKEQAYVQFELWTGQKAPIKVIQDALVAVGK